MRSESLRGFLKQKRGRAAAMARALGVSQSLVSNWVAGRQMIPVLRCFEIERYTKGCVRALRLRHDLADGLRGHS